jgi:hypothetical protein
VVRNVNTDTRMAAERQRTMLASAQERRQALRLRELHQASRREQRARKLLQRAQRSAQRARSELDAMH